MGIPSPFVGISPSPLSRSSSKHGTPEHSLLCALEGVCHDADDLLPDAAVDVTEYLRSSLLQEPAEAADEDDLLPDAAVDVADSLRSSLHQEPTRTLDENCGMQLDRKVDNATKEDTAEIDTGAAVLEWLQMPCEVAHAEPQVPDEGETGTTWTTPYGCQWPATVMYAMPAPWLATGSYANLPPSPERQARRPKWPFGSMPPFNRAPTTVEIKGFPPDLTQTKLMSVFDSQGFHGLYDFVFLPMEEFTGENEGYALVNLVRHVHALALVDHLLEYTGCTTKWSFTLQGQDALIRCFQEEPWLNSDTPNNMVPQIFMGGMEMPFPVLDRPPQKPTRHRRTRFGKYGSDDDRSRTGDGRWPT